MNKERRKDLQDLADKLEEIKSELETIMEQEQDYLDNMPENMKEGEKGEIAQSAIDNLQQAIDDVENAIMACGDAAQ